MIPKKLYFWSTYVIIFGIFANNHSRAESEPPEKILIDKLMKEYNILERPVRNAIDTLDITVGLNITNVYHLTNTEGYLVTSMVLSLTWVDTNLMWNSSEFNGIERLAFHPHRIWRPDIFMRNSVDSTLDNTAPTNIVVSYDGNCTYNMPGVFRTPCTTHMTNYPFDQHKCSMKLGSWTYNAAKINLQLKSKNAEFGRLVSHTEWKLIGAPARVDWVYYANDPDPYTEVTFIMEWKRSGEAIFSRCSLTLLLGVLGALLTFLLPQTSVQRIPLGIMTLLSIFWMEDSIQTTLGDKPSNLVSYYRKLTFLISVSIISNILIVYFYHLNPSIHQIPVWLRKIVFDSIPSYVLLSRPIKDTSDCTSTVPGTCERIVDRTESKDQCEELVSNLESLLQKMDSRQTQKLVLNDWEYLAVVLDRLVFLFFLVVFILFFIAFYCSFA